MTMEEHITKEIKRQIIVAINRMDKDRNSDKILPIILVRVMERQTNYLFIRANTIC